jgi:hypothetical protein
MKQNYAIARTIRDLTGTESKDPESVFPLDSRLGLTRMLEKAREHYWEQNDLLDKGYVAFYVYRRGMLCAGQALHWVPPRVC